MTGRELLEMAAKAAGYPCYRPMGDEGFQVKLDPLHRWFDWNPLTDDGDALRLSVQCKIDVKHYDVYVVAWWDNYFGTGRIDYYGDPCAATRRAIVLAAAEIGKQGGDKP